MRLALFFGGDKLAGKIIKTNVGEGFMPSIRWAAGESILGNILDIWKLCLYNIKIKEILMPQISLYIDEPTLKKVENAAMRQKVSISKWVAEQIRSRVDPVYPVDYESLFGSIDDDTFTEPEDVAPSSDTARENL